MCFRGPTLPDSPEVERIQPGRQHARPGNPLDFQQIPDLREFALVELCQNLRLIPAVGLILAELADSGTALALVELVRVSLQIPDPGALGKMAIQ